MDKKEIHIQGSYCGRFDIAMHIQFHTSIYDLLMGGDVQLQKLFITPERMDEWRGFIDLEIDFVKRIRAHVNTKEMRETDRKRSRCLTYLFGQVRNAENAPSSELQEAGERVRLVCNTCRGLQQESAMVKTAGIDALLFDLKKEQMAEDIATLGLDSIIRLLEETNEAYRALENERTDDRLEEELPVSREIRPQTDGCFRRVCVLVEAAFLIHTNPEDRAAISSLADQINFRIRSFRAKYNQIMGHRKENDGEEK